MLSPKSKISWSWLACFTDSEGSIHYANKGSLLQVSWVQAKKNEILIDEVAKFLSEKEISFSDSEGISNSGTQFRRIVIGHQESAKTVLVKMMPYLILKNDKAANGLEFLKQKRKDAKGRATRCKHGHIRTIENTYVAPKTGKKSCLICRRRAGMESYHRNKPVPGYAVP